MDPHLINLETGIFFETGVVYSSCDQTIYLTEFHFPSEYVIIVSDPELMNRQINLN